MLFRHGSDHDDGHETSEYDQRHTDILQRRDKPVAEDDKSRTQPSDQDECQIRMPLLDDKVRVVVGIHLHRDIRRDGNDRGHVEDPAKEVQSSAEKPNTAAPVRTCCH